jgi:hypothetical protein
MYRIDGIAATAFRGIRSEMSVDLGGHHLLLYGENGFGKSSIVEALEYALTGDIASLSQRGQRVSVKRHAPNILCDPKDMCASADLAEGEIHRTVCGGTAADDLELGGLERFLAGAADGTFILRRRQLLAFIEAPDDKSRYEMLRPFLRLDRFEAFEAAAKEASASLTANALRKQEALMHEASSLIDRFALDDDAEITRDGLLTSAIAGMRAAGLEVPPQEAQDVDRLLRAAESVAGDPAAVERQLKLRRACEAWSDLGTSIAVAREKLADLLTAADNLESEELAEYAFFENVLTEGRTWIESQDLSDCPLCEQPIDATRVLERIDTRIREHSSLISARSTVRAAIADFQDAARAMSDAFVVSETKWHDAGLADEGWPGIDVRANLHCITQLAAEKNNPTCKAVRDTIAKSNSADDWTATVALQSTLAGFGCAPPRGSEAGDGLITAIDILRWLRDRWTDLQARRQQCVAAASRAETASSLHARVEAARKTAIRQVFEGIQGDINTIYDAFHPDEPLGGVEIEIKDSASGSAVIRACFADRQAEDPRALYSEAHQDTLGLSIFLALRKKRLAANPEFPVMVLDDVLSSIDDPHGRRVAEFLIGTVSQWGQLLVTTHDLAWYERLREVERRTGKEQKFANRRIVSFSREEGPHVVDMASDYDRLCDDLTKTAHEEFAPIVGRFLDDLCKELRMAWRLSIRANRDERYSIGEIWPAIQSRCKKYTGLSDAAERVGATTYLRNPAAHSEAAIKALPRSEVIALVEAVRNFYPAVRCLGCHSFIEPASRPKGNLTCKKGCLTYSLGDSPSHEQVGGGTTSAG